MGKERREAGWEVLFVFGVPEQVAEGAGVKNKLKAIHTRSSNPSFSRPFPDLSEPRLPIHEMALLGTTVRYY